MVARRDDIDLEEEIVEERVVHVDVLGQMEVGRRIAVVGGVEGQGVPEGAGTAVVEQSAVMIGVVDWLVFVLLPLPD